MLDLVWSAGFRDGSRLFQFKDLNGQTEETPSREVFDNQENLVEFCLYNIHTGMLYIVDLRLGTIKVVRQGGTDMVPDEDTVRGRDYRYRLIYFRRVVRTLNASLKEIGDANITYFLGYQFTDESGKNHKRLMQIRSDDGMMIY